MAVILPPPPPTLPPPPNSLLFGGGGVDGKNSFGDSFIGQNHDATSRQTNYSNLGVGYANGPKKRHMWRFSVDSDLHSFHLTTTLRCFKYRPTMFCPPWCKKAQNGSFRPSGHH